VNIDAQVAAGVTMKNVDFENSVVACFAFLLDAGFRIHAKTPDLVRFSRDDIEVTIYYDVASGEMDLDVGVEAERYSMSELIRSKDASRAAEYRSWASTTAGGVRAGMEALAKLFAEYGRDMVAGDKFALRRMREQRVDWLRRYEKNVAAARGRVEAEVAFRESRYAEAARLLSALGPEATESEKLKLRIAMRKTNRSIEAPNK
jgi:hypothetical protein